MRSPAIWLGALLAIASPSHALTVQRFTASPKAASANAYLVCGKTQALLFDVSMTRSDAKRLAEFVRGSRHDLTTIFISHAHPDHFLGLQELVTAFPRAKVVATPLVCAEVRKVGPGLISLLKGTLGADAPDRLVIPTPLQVSNIRLEGTALPVLAFHDGESGQAAALYIPDSHTLLTGDLVYSKTHLFVREKRIEGWLSQLGEVERACKRLGVKTISPGHGPQATVSVIAENRAYLKDLRQALAHGSRQQVLDSMLRRYPTWGGRTFLTQYTLNAYFGAQP